jgi:hypothetical protein
MASRDEHAHLLDALATIDPSTVSYQEWVDCGMALHESGYSWQDWDEWSRRDTARYHEGECEKKWRSFGDGTTRVTSGTIIHMAEQRGWRQPTYAGGDKVYDWDDIGVAAGPAATEAASIPVMDVDDSATSVNQVADSVVEVVSVRDESPVLVVIENGVHFCSSFLWNNCIISQCFQKVKSKFLPAR